MVVQDQTEMFLNLNHHPVCAASDASHFFLTGAATPPGQEGRWPGQPLLADDLDEDPLFPSPIEFSVEDLFPRAEVQLRVGDGNDNFAAHHLALDMRVRVVFSGVVVAVLTCGLVRDQPLEKIIVVFQEASLIVINVDAGADVHGVDQA